MTHLHKQDNHTKISTNRLEAFSDGVIAIIITITVLELKIPLGDTKEVLLPLIPLFITYMISFQTIGTYWNNHHHLLQATKHVSPGIMWANLHLLFWLSFIPFSIVLSISSMELKSLWPPDSQSESFLIIFL
jgi:uncharacterized membrane protein